VSNSGDNKAEVAQARAFSRLEAAAARLLEERRRASERAERAEARVAELEAHLAAVASDGDDPVELKSSISRLQSEKEDLVERIERGREGVDRLLSRIRFLQEQRDT
jgi:chromosome segregation ATPase